MSIGPQLISSILRRGCAAQSNILNIEKKQYLLFACSRMDQNEENFSILLFCESCQLLIKVRQEGGGKDCNVRMSIIFVPKDV